MKIDQEKFALASRHYQRLQGRFIMVSALLVGTLYIFAGLMLSNSAMKPLEDGFSLVALFLGMTAFFIAPLLILISYLFAPACPHCHRKLLKPHIQTASGLCPHCHQILFDRMKLNQIELPPHNPYLNPVFFQGTTLILSVILFSALQFLDAETLLARLSILLVIEGILIVAVLILPLLYYRLREKRRCGICNSVVSEDIADMTGHCSACGSPVNKPWPPPEPEPIAELPTWEELQQHRREIRKMIGIATVTAIVIIAVSFLLMLSFENRDTIFYIIVTGGIIAVPVGIAYYTHLRIEKMTKAKARKFHVYDHCPYCQNKPQKMVTEIVSIVLDVEEEKQRRHRLDLNLYGRCRKCRRRLIRQMPK